MGTTVLLFGLDSQVGNKLLFLVQNFPCIKSFFCIVCHLFVCFIGFFVYFVCLFECKELLLLRLQCGRDMCSI